MTRRAPPDLTLEALVLDAGDPAVGRVVAAPAARERLAALREAGVRVIEVPHAGHGAAEAILEELSADGIGPGLTLFAGRGFGAPALLGVALPDPDEDVLLELLEDQLSRRRAGRVPWIDEDPSWTVAAAGAEPSADRLGEALFTVADGRIGTRGTLEEDAGLGEQPAVVAGGIFDDGEGGGHEHLLPAPVWTALGPPPGDETGRQRMLDLRTGVLARRDAGGFRSLRFASAARPGIMALRAEAPGTGLVPGAPLRRARQSTSYRHGMEGETVWATTESVHGGGITAAARDVRREDGDRRTVERVAAYVAEPARVPAPEEALERLRAAEAGGFDALLAEHRAVWARRWEDAGVSIVGDPDAELAVRFALFHLLSSVPGEGEGALGARGVSGPAYGGHVFWDSDVFALPVLAAVRPEAARAMLEYRLRRLPAARRAAIARRRAGARFPWESAHDGTDVTPAFARTAEGGIVPIRTGEHEEHITADVAWGANEYVAWTGDEDFGGGGGLLLLVETARYWASRVRTDGRGTGHIYGVTGPDEYHEVVDDNAYTNVMARWNLRRAAHAAERDPAAAARTGVTRAETEAWHRVADSLVDGFDEATGRYEQFEGYFRLEPLIVAEVAERPVAADVLLGRRRLAGSQVIKQADVLMLHHLVPEQVAPGSLRPNLDYYEPRSAHGSSLSPAIHAALLARAGEPDRALELFRTAARLDLDDLTGTSARGLHVATQGGLWQALTYGFAGVRPGRDRLTVDPALPEAWDAVEIRLRYRGARLRLEISNEAVSVQTDRAVPLGLPGGPAVQAAPGRTELERGSKGWTERGRRRAA